MLEKNQRIRAMIDSLADMALLFLAYVLANYLHFNYLRYYQPGGAGPALDIARDTIYVGALYAVVMVLVFWLLHLYDASRLRGLWQRSLIILVGNALGILVLEALLYQFRIVNFSRLVVVLFYLFGTGFLIFKRMLRRWYDRWRHRRGEGFRHILLVGGGKVAGQYLKALEQNPYYGFRVDGYLASRPNPDFAPAYLGRYDKLAVVLDTPGID